MIEVDDEAKSRILTRAIYYVEKGWCQKFFCLDKEGNPTSWNTRQTVYFSMNGAILKSSYIEFIGAKRIDEVCYMIRWEFDEVFFQMFGMNLDRFNTIKDHSEVLSALRELKEYVEA